MLFETSQLMLALDSALIYTYMKGEVSWWLEHSFPIWVNCFKKG